MSENIKESTQELSQEQTIGQDQIASEINDSADIDQEGPLNEPGDPKKF